jgi:hypothetical protein
MAEYMDIQVCHNELRINVHIAQLNKVRAKCLIDTLMAKTRVVPIYAIIRVHVQLIFLSASLLKISLSPAALFLQLPKDTVSAVCVSLSLSLSLTHSLSLSLPTRAQISAQ